MITPADCLTPIAEARICLANGLMAANALLTSGADLPTIAKEISRHLNDAMVKLAEAELPPRPPGAHSIYPSQEVALGVIERLPQSETMEYRLAPFGDGRCAIDVLQRVGKV